MLNDLKVDELLEKVDSRYGLVMASAKRARQINEYTADPGSQRFSWNTWTAGPHPPLSTR